MFYKEEKIIHVIELFCNSFDEKDWDTMHSVLNDRIFIDYSSFRGTEPCTVTPDQFIDLRKSGLSGLITKHSCSNYEISFLNEKLLCSCQFVIRRFEMEGENYFHSYGNYEFGFQSIADSLKIISIKQLVERNEGNRNIHGAFKQLKSD